MIESSVLVACGGVVASLFAYFGGRGQSAASQQVAFNQTAELLLKSISHERDDCQKQLAEVRAEIAIIRGDLAQAQQRTSSLMAFLDRNGISVPPQKQVEPIFVLDSFPKEPL